MAAYFDRATANREADGYPPVDEGAVEVGGFEHEEDDPMDHGFAVKAPYELPHVLPLYRVPRFLLPGVPPVPVFREQHRVLEHPHLLLHVSSFVGDIEAPTAEFITRISLYRNAVVKHGLRVLWSEILDSYEAIDNAVFEFSGDRPEFFDVFVKEFAMNRRFDLRMDKVFSTLASKYSSVCTMRATSVGMMAAMPFADVFPFLDLNALFRPLLCMAHSDHAEYQVYLPVFDMYTSQFTDQYIKFVNKVFRIWDMDDIPSFRGKCVNKLCASGRH
jgi:hypothetical protein